MIEIQNEAQKLNSSNLNLLRSAVRFVLEKFGNPDVDMTIRLTGDEEMRALNKNFRGIDETTDVLSFNQNYTDPETNQVYLGDIIISVSKAEQQAVENSQSLAAECAFLAIHGTLHLLGYEHSEPDQKQIMWQMQNEIFQTIINQNQEDGE
jgi:probable rRNA maturation factor